jgi:hypothetical protein
VTLLLFPDNTVLVNFALVSRMALLETLLARRGKWTLTIAGECDRGSRIPGQQDMALAASFLGEPIVPTAGERISTLVIQAQLAAPGDRASAHLGEAESFAVIGSRALPAIFVTDDIPAVPGNTYASVPGETPRSSPARDTPGHRVGTSG